jgi:Fe-S cluster assembly ATPase SufC
MKRITVQLHLANEKNLSFLIITHLSSVLEKYHPEQTKTERLERFEQPDRG